MPPVIPERLRFLILCTTPRSEASCQAKSYYDQEQTEVNQKDDQRFARWLEEFSLQCMV